MAFLTTALGLTLCFFWTSAFEPIKPDFNLDGVEGDWWVVGMASNSAAYVRVQQWWFSGLTNFTAAANGSMDFSYRSMTRNGSCYMINNSAVKTDTPGEFITKAFGKLLKFVSVKKDEYALVYARATDLETGNCLVMHMLFAREQCPRKELLKRFQYFTSGKGISEENTVFTSPKDLKAKCVARPAV